VVAGSVRSEKALIFTMQQPHDRVARPIRQWRFIAPLALFFYCGGAQHLPAVPNPVIPLLADCGVLRYQGEYYISGTFMGGRMRVSSDLVHWSEPIHVFSMKNQWTEARQRQDQEIHACDITFDNGVFHFFWSVNHFPLRQIGHATAPRPLGPYQEPVTESWFDGRIDPHLFVDHDGSYYFYTVKFNDGNVIWGQSMQDPWTLNGKPAQLLSTLPDSWEARDRPGFRVNEAPWVVHYRDRYYMLYNANHTAAAFGNYGIGCAEASHPLGFSNPTKYVS
jgi:beta-xylosidase